MFWEGWSFLAPRNTKKILEIGDFPHISNLDIGSEIRLKLIPSEEERRKFENTEIERFFESIASHRCGLDCVFINADFLGGYKFIEQVMKCTSFLKPDGMMFVYSENGINPKDEHAIFCLSPYECRKFNFLGFSRSNAILFPEIHQKDEAIRLSPSLQRMTFGVIGKLLKHFQQIKYRSRRVFYFFYFLRFLNYFRLSRKFFRHELFVFVQNNGEQRESYPWFFDKDSHISVLPVKRKNIVPVFSDDGGLKSFCKYSSGKQGKEIISNEVKIINHLADYEFDTAIVPKVVNYKTSLERSFLEISAQSELKYPKKMGEVHVNWLIELSSKTSVSMPFSESEFFFQIQEKLKVIKFYFKDQAGIWVNELCEEMVAVIYDSNLPFGVVQREFPFYHANMISDSEKIFVFDWEFGRVNYPPLFDLFHCMLSDKHISGAESVSFPVRVTNTLFISKHSQVFIKRYIEGLKLSSKIVYPLFVLFLIDQLACYLPFVDELEEVKGYLDALQKLKNKSSFSFEKWMSTVSVE